MSSHAVTSNDFGMDAADLDLSLPEPITLALPNNANGIDDGYSDNLRRIPLLYET